ncbi:HypC/HybG/HupF family hydrogenase formation chaperone [Arthrobacter sp.]|uniref:HypC/HybG/HupF family hydrogenase formation chaperone n=1 Tax=Arthrobacter sp. TaxID=1667 RepID=UPI00339AAE1D
MCLGIPGQVIGPIDGYGNQLALVDVAGVQRKINIGLLDDGPLPPGSWVLIHMGFALERVDPAGAERAMSGLELMGQPRQADDDGIPPSAEHQHDQGEHHDANESIRTT